MKKEWQGPTIESESAFETLVAGCEKVDEPTGGQECGAFPLNS